MDVVLLPDQLFCQREADFSAAYNDDFHVKYPFAYDIILCFHQSRRECFSEHIETEKRSLDRPLTVYYTYQQPARLSQLEYQL